MPRRKGKRNDMLPAFSCTAAATPEPEVGQELSCRIGGNQASTAAAAAVLTGDALLLLLLLLPVLLRPPYPWRWLCVLDQM